MNRFRYSSWDGTHEIFDLNEDDLIEALSDDLLSHGDILHALRSLMQKGFSGNFSGKLPGIRDLMNRLKERKRETLNKYDLDSTVKELQKKLDHIIQKEREGIRHRLNEARQKSLENEMTEENAQELKSAAEEKLNFLDNLPGDMGGAIKKLSSYNFMDHEAGQKFKELLEILKKHIMDSMMKDLSQRLKGLSPDYMNHLKDMMKELNRMIRDKEQGMEPDFQNFMSQFGNMFGSRRPRNLDELMKSFQKSMAQAQSLLNSLSPEDRQSLNDLLESIIDNNDLQQELSEFTLHMQRFFPASNLESQFNFHGDESLSLNEAMGLMDELQRIEQLEQQLESLRWGGAIEDIDSQQLGDILGDDAYQIMDAWKHMLEKLEEAGYIHMKGRNMELTPRAIRKIGQKSLRDVFSYLKKEGTGKHPINKKGYGGDLADETKTYEFGDPFLIHIERTLSRALWREGPGTPLNIKPDDFEIYNTEQSSRCTTVLLIDLSWSMPVRGNFLAAKKVALALENLIHTQFPRDTLYMVGFSDYARKIKSSTLAQLTWDDYVYGTNMQHAFILSRQILGKHKGGNRQIIMVTDGEPTAHLEHNNVYFSYPPHPRTLELTLLEAKRCARDGIVINTFMLDQEHYLTHFIEQLARINKGRVFFTSADKLGEYILVDYLSNKRLRKKF